MSLGMGHPTSVPRSGGEKNYVSLQSILRRSRAANAEKIENIFKNPLKSKQNGRFP
jgi:hypothetical protein